MAGMEEAFPDPETEDALNEFNFLNDSQEGAGEAQTSGDWAPGQLGSDISPVPPCITFKPVQLGAHPLISLSLLICTVRCISPLTLS